jgi:hypothetical protein
MLPSCRRIGHPSHNAIARRKQAHFLIPETFGAHRYDPLKSIDYKPNGGS